MDLKVLLFDIVNEQNRPATPLICSERRCRVKLSAKWERRRSVRDVNVRANQRI